MWVLHVVSKHQQWGQTLRDRHGNCFVTMAVALVSPLMTKPFD